jgi:hypothetical protein
VVVNNVKYLVYTGVVHDSTNGTGLCDRLDAASPCEKNPTTIRIPIGNIVTSQTLRDLIKNPTTKQWWGPGSPFGSKLDDIITHTAGMPGTYLGEDAIDEPGSDLAVSDYCIGDLDPNQGFNEVARGRPAPANPFIGTKEISRTASQILTSDWRAATAGDDVTSQRTNLEFSEQEGESFLESNTISASVSVEGEYGSGVVGSTKVTLSAAGSFSNSFAASLGRGTAFSGTVGSIPDSRLAGEQFQWRMFVCKVELAPGVPIWVQNYQVRNYSGVYESAPAPGAKAAEDLGPVEALAPVGSSVVSTRPTFQWTQPRGTVQSYDLELEALGRTDHRILPAGTFADFTAASTRVADGSFRPTVEQQLLPGQLYRWRVTSNNFFYKSEASDWQYLVTQGDERLSVGDGAVVEGASSNRLLRFPVTLSAPKPHDVTFNYVTVPVTAQVDDFVLKSGQATIAAGSTSTAVSVAVRGDLAAEGAENFLFLVTPTATSPVQVQRAVGTGRIIDDEPQKSGSRISMGDATVVEGRGKNRWVLFPVTLSRPATADVTVKYATQDQTANDEEDYWAAQGTVTIPKGAVSTYVKVKVRGDATVEPDETFRVRLLESGGTPIQRVNGAGKIVDDD